MTKVIEYLGPIKGEKTLQKLVYLVQRHGQFMGYHFQWFSNGPINPEIFSDVKESEFLGLLKINFENSVPVYEACYQQLSDSSFWKKQMQSQFLTEQTLDIIDALNSENSIHNYNPLFLELLAALDYDKTTTSQYLSTQNSATTYPNEYLKSAHDLLHRFYE